MATGNSQQVSITASSNLSNEDIEKAIKDAEAHANEDKKRKEEIEIRNNAESLVYNSQKTLDDLGDKLSGEEKAKVETEIEATKKALEGSDTEAIKQASEKLTTVFYDISQKIYNQQAQANQTGATENAQNTENTNNNGNVYDTEYKVEEEGNDNNNQ